MVEAGWRTPGVIGVIDKLVVCPEHGPWRRVWRVFTLPVAGT